MKILIIYILALLLTVPLQLYSKHSAYAAETEVVELYEPSSIAQKLSKSTNNSIIFIDIDDTIITPKSKMFRSSSPYYDFIEQIKNERDRLANVDKILAAWRLSRKVMLVSDKWPKFIQNMKKAGYKVYGITKMSGGSLEYIDKMEEWRYQELKNLGINFNLTHRNKSDYILIPSSISGSTKDAAIFYNGVFFTGQYSKNDVIKKFLEDIYPDKMVLIDDRKENVVGAAGICAENNISYLGVIYRGIDLLLDKPDSRVVSIQKEYLLMHYRWLEDDEAERYLEK